MGEELACQREKGDPNDVYAVIVKTNATKTVQIKYNNDLYSFSVTFHQFC